MNQVLQENVINSEFADYMWLHIRGVGEWTNRLYEYFEKEQEKLHNGDIQGIPVPSKDRHFKHTEKNNESSLTKIRSSIMRTISTNPKKTDVQLVGFSNNAFQEVNLRNPKVTIDLAGSVPGSSAGKKPSTFRPYKMATCDFGFLADLTDSNLRRPTPEKRLQRLLMATKVPLEKSLSLPDMQKKAKNKERILA